MATKTKAEPRRIRDEIRSEDGTVLGTDVVEESLITVWGPNRSPETTSASVVGDHEGLARLVLSERPPTTDQAKPATPAADLKERIARRGGRVLAPSDIIEHLHQWEPATRPVEVYLTETGGDDQIRRAGSTETRQLFNGWAKAGAVLTFEADA